MKRTVLLAEDHQTLRRAFVRALASIPNVEIVDTASAVEARDLIDQSAPDLLVSDLDLEGGSGLDILAHLHQVGLRIPAIFVTAYLGSFRDQIPSGREIEIHEKPVSVTKLRRLVEAKLDAEEEAAPFSVVEYVQLACLGSHSLRIGVYDDADELVGEIVVSDGELWSANTDESHGMGALGRLFDRTDVHARCHPLVDAGEKNIRERWESALIEATRRGDEFSAGLGGWDSSVAWGPGDTWGGGLVASQETAGDEESGVFDEEGEPLQVADLEADRRARVQVDELLDDATDALLSSDYAAAEAAFERVVEIAPNHRTALANLLRLRQIHREDE